MSISATNCVYCKHGDALYNIEGYLGMYCKRGADCELLIDFVLDITLGHVVEQCNEECNDYIVDQDWADIKDKLDRIDSYRVYGRRVISANDLF